MKERRKIPSSSRKRPSGMLVCAPRGNGAEDREGGASGQTTTLSEVLLRARQRAGTPPTVSSQDRPARYRALASGEKGLRYQTYLKMPLHEAFSGSGNAWRDNTWRGLLLLRPELSPR
jgi:hypothetical protein